MLRSEAGVPLQVFFEQWREQLTNTRRDLSDELKKLPRLRGEVSFVPLSSISRKIRYHVAIEPPPTPGTRYSFLYHSLSAFDETVDPKSIQHEQNAYPERAQDELSETHSRGGRLFWTFGLEVPELGCQVISGWHRQEIE
jgi:hypothetical protein